jgi:hypothetical protein
MAITNQHFEHERLSKTIKHERLSRIAGTPTIHSVEEKNKIISDDKNLTLMKYKLKKFMVIKF